MMYIVWGIVGLVVLVVLYALIWCIRIMKDPKFAEKASRKNAEKLKRYDEKIRQNDEKIRQIDEKIRQNDEKIRQNDEKIRRNDEGAQRADEVIRMSKEAAETIDSLEKLANRGAFTESELQELGSTKEQKLKVTNQLTDLAERDTERLQRDIRLTLSFNNDKHLAEMADLEVLGIEIDKQSRELMVEYDELTETLKRWVEVGQQRSSGYKQDEHLPREQW